MHTHICLSVKLLKDILINTGEPWDILLSEISQEQKSNSIYFYLRQLFTVFKNHRKGKSKGDYQGLK